MQEFHLTPPLGIMASLTSLGHQLTELPLMNILVAFIARGDFLPSKLTGTFRLHNISVMAIFARCRDVPTRKLESCLLVGFDAINSGSVCVNGMTRLTRTAIRPRPELALVGVFMAICAMLRFSDSKVRGNLPPAGVHSRLAVALFAVNRHVFSFKLVARR